MLRPILRSLPLHSRASPELGYASDGGQRPRRAPGHRRELTTGEKAKHKAEETAPQIIRNAYAVKGERTPWDNAIKLMRQHMAAKNLRLGSIQQYELVITVLRKVFPESAGPADITAALAQEFVVKRMATKRGEKKLSPRTVEGTLTPAAQPLSLPPPPK